MDFSRFFDFSYTSPSPPLITEFIEHVIWVSWEGFLREWGGVTFSIGP